MTDFLANNSVEKDRSQAALVGSLRGFAAPSRQTLYPREMPKVTQEEHLTAIQSAIGKALWQIQAFEDTLAHLIAIVLKIPAGSSLEEAERILENVRDRLTLGRLLEKAREVISIDASVDVFLRRFLDERNWLVHRSWRTHGNFLSDTQDFIDLNYRLFRLSSDALEFNQLFAGIVEDYVRNAGVSEADVRAISEDFTNVWRRV